MTTPLDRPSIARDRAAAAAGARPDVDDPVDLAELAYRQRFPVIADLLDRDPDVPPAPGPPL